MKIVYTTETTHEELVTIHFPCELPVLVPTVRARPWLPGFRCRLSRSTPLAGLGEHLAKANRGRCYVELARPAETFRNFAADVVVIPGLIELVAGDRYSLTLKIGRCFDQPSVCLAVAGCVLQHFYPGESAAVIEYLPDPNPFGAQRLADQPLVVSAYR